MWEPDRRRPGLLVLLAAALGGCVSYLGPAVEPPARPPAAKEFVTDAPITVSAATSTTGGRWPWLTETEKRDFAVTALRDTGLFASVAPATAGDPPEAVNLRVLENPAPNTDATSAVWIPVLTFGLFPLVEDWDLGLYLDVGGAGELRCPWPVSKVFGWFALPLWILPRWTRHWDSPDYRQHFRQCVVDQAAIFRQARAGR